MMQQYLIGNTLRIVATFYDFDKKLTEPQLVIFKLYDHKYNKTEEIVLGANNRISEGVYYYDHIINADVMQNMKFFYEFYGEIGGKPSLNRGSFSTKFI